MPPFETIIVAIVILFLIVSLYKEIVGPTTTFIIAIIILGITRVLTPREILSGFANEQVAIIVMLLMLGDIYRRTSVLDILFNKVFDKANTTFKFNAIVMSLVAPLSAFLNNTPLVALIMPYVHSRARKTGEYVSQLMIPLSFAAILGGCSTLIGTSTNLIINGLLTDQNIIPNLQALDIFDFAPVGVPMMVIGILYLLYFGPRLLPKRHSPSVNINSIKRKYIVETRIKSTSKWVGKTIKEAGISKMEDLRLLEILRNDLRITTISQDITLKENDILLFTGSTTAIANLLDSTEGLIIPAVGMFAHKKNTEVIEVVISHKSGMIRKSLKEVNFRERFDATAIAIHRNGETLSGKIGNIELKAGDTILLLSGIYFYKRLQETTDLYLISRIKEFNRLGVWRTALLIGGTILVIALSTFKLIRFFNGLLTLLTLLTLFKITRPKDIIKSIDHELVVIIAMSLALGVAMIKTGMADILANTILTIFKPMGKVGVLFGIYFITSLLAAFITNKAAVAVIFPVSLTIGLELRAELTPFVLIVAYAAAANFSTPIGYQTNLMIYGPGGYKFKDFFKIGTPLTIIYMIVTVTILSLMYF